MEYNSFEFWNQKTREYYEARFLSENKPVAQSVIVLKPWRKKYSNSFGGMWAEWIERYYPVEKITSSELGVVFEEVQAKSGFVWDKFDECDIIDNFLRIIIVY